jgi:hypothetical protein
MIHRGMMTRFWVGGVVLWDDGAVLVVVLRLVDEVGD